MPRANYLAAFSIGVALHSVIWGYMVFAPAFSLPLLSTPACLAQPLATTYAALAPAANGLLCKYNTILLSAMSTPGGSALVQYSLWYTVTAALVAVYESFRPSSRRSASTKAQGAAEGFGMHLGQAQLATWFLLVGQVAYSGFVLPAYYALVAWSTPARWRHQHHKPDIGDEVFIPREQRNPREKHRHTLQHDANIPRSSFLYTTLISAFTVVLPTAYLLAASAGEAYDAASIWQLWPAYMLIVNLGVPPLLRRSFSATAPTRGIVLIAALGIATSVYSQFYLVTAISEDDLSLADILPFPCPVGFGDDNWKADWKAGNTVLSTATHRLFALDFAAKLIATAGHVIFALRRRTRGGAGQLIYHTVVFLIVAAIAGPGAATMLLWAKGEFGSLRAAKARKAAKEAEGVKGKGKAKKVK